jgi:hypothetical protein
MNVCALASSGCLLQKTGCTHHEILIVRNALHIRFPSNLAICARIDI